MPAVNRKELESSGKVRVLRLYEAFLGEPIGEERGLDGLEKLVDIKPRRVRYRLLKKYLEESTIIAFEGPYVDRVETDIGEVELEIEPRILVTPIESSSPLTIMPIAEIPIEAYRRYVGFRVSEFVEAYNAPAAMAGAANKMMRMIYSQFPISKEKAALMHMLAILIQGIGEPSVIAHRKDPIRGIRNLLRIILGASEDKLIRLERKKRNRLKELASKYLKKSREFFYDDLTGHSELVLRSP